MNTNLWLEHIIEENLKTTHHGLGPLFAMYFTGIMVHGVLLDYTISMCLVPVISDKTVY